MSGREKEAMVTFGLIVIFVYGCSLILTSMMNFMTMLSTLDTGVIDKSNFVFSSTFGFLLLGLFFRFNSIWRPSQKQDVEIKPEKEL